MPKIVHQLNTEVHVKLPSSTISASNHKAQNLAEMGYAELPLAVQQNFDWSNFRDTINKKYGGVDPSKGSMSRFILPPQNQGECGSCWAINSAKLTADRFAIATLTSPQMLSTSNVLICAGAPFQGCSGGDPYIAGCYIATYGIVSDQDWSYDNTKTTYEQCLGTYTQNQIQSENLYNGFKWMNGEQQTCNNHYLLKPNPADRNDPFVQKSVKPSDSNCNTRCWSGGKRIKVISDSIEHLNFNNATPEEHQYAIKTEIYTNGPVIGSMLVYDDFEHIGDYNEQHVTSNGDIDYPYEYWGNTNHVYIQSGESRQIGGHAVEIIGWGFIPASKTKNWSITPTMKKYGMTADSFGDVPYWIICNSWGTLWNGCGYARIAMSNSKLGINMSIGLDNISNKDVRSPVCWKVDVEYKNPPVLGNVVTNADQATAPTASTPSTQPAPSTPSTQPSPSTPSSQPAPSTPSSQPTPSIASSSNKTTWIIVAVTLGVVIIAIGVSIYLYKRTPTPGEDSIDSFNQS